MSLATYAKITREIAALQAQADAIKKKEVDGVVARIKEAIAAYGLTARDLGLNPSSSRATKVGRGGAVRYSDGQGNTWSGHGRRPKWFLDAVAAGKSPQELQVAGTASGSKAKARRQPTAKKRRGDSAQAGYTDGTNSWTGRGRRPQWFLDAIAGGKTADELRA
jgi:DNA-binding protein H-NS